MAGIGLPRNLTFPVFRLIPLILPRHRAHPMPRDLRVNYVGAPPAFCSLRVHHFPSRQVVVLTYVLGQSTVH
jgi:hypothetical protein